MSTCNAQVHSNDIFSTNETLLFIFGPFFQNIAASVQYSGQLRQGHQYKNGQGGGYTKTHIVKAGQTMNNNCHVKSSSYIDVNY